MSEIKKALKGMSRDKTGGADGLSIDLIKNADVFLLDKLTILFTKWQNCIVPSTWKNATIIQVHKKGDIKYLKN